MQGLSGRSMECEHAYRLWQSGIRSRQQRYHYKRVGCCRRLQRAMGENRSLEDPVPPYSLQMSEVEVYGTPAAGISLLLVKDVADTAVGVGQPATLGVTVNAINGDNALLTYQWQKNGINITDATNATYTTGAILSTDEGTKYKVMVGYPGLPSLTSKEATIKLNYALFGEAPQTPISMPGGQSPGLLTETAEVFSMATLNSRRGLPIRLNWLPQSKWKASISIPGRTLAAQTDYQTSESRFSQIIMAKSGTRYGRRISLLMAPIPAWARNSSPHH